MKYYAGIGSRGIPLNITLDMNSIARKLSEQGYTLRSGNAEGADQAFASGVLNGLAQIWLPWSDFELAFQRSHPDHTYIVDEEDDVEAYESIKEFHPNPYALGRTSRQFMARNYRQVIGRNEPNSEFVVCWTEDGQITGGTGQAMRIANKYQIPIFNLYDLTVDEVMKEIEKLNLIN